MSIKALFLDRDGVINKDTGHAHTKEEFVPLEENLNMIKELIAKDGYEKVFIITNQAGIARGYYTEEEFLKFQAWVEEFLGEYGIPIEKTYYCPNHPTAAVVPEYAKVCEYRKPAPGMLLQAAKEYDINMAESLFIGDRDTDMEAGKAAGCKTLKV